MKRDLPRETLVALVDLSRSDNGKRVIALFEEERREAQLALETALEEATIRKLQGKVQFLRDFLERVAKSPDLLEHLKLGR